MTGYCEPWDLPALRAEFPEWEITLRDLTRVTAVLRADTWVRATEDPVSPRVMANVLRDRRIQETRHTRPV
jgi:hypothetical protein